MKVSLTRDNDNNWVVTPLEGRFAGQQVAVCEGVTLRFAELEQEALVGDMTALWGGVVIEAVHSDPFTVRGLGIGRPFDCRSRLPIHWDGSAYRSYTGVRIKSARAVAVFRSAITCWDPKEAECEAGSEVVSSAS